MADQQTVEALASDLAERVKAQISEAQDKLREGLASKEDVEALQAQLVDDVLEERVKTMFASLLDSDEGKDIVRKVRFAGADEDDLSGSKYGRMGVSVADLEFLHDLQDSLKGQKRVGDSGVYDGPSEDLAKAVTSLSKRRVVTASIARADDERKVEEMRSRGLLDAAGYDRAMRAIQHVYGAMDTAETGFGLEIIGAQYVNELWTGARRLSRVFNLIEQFDMTDPTAYLPVEAAIPELLFVAESTASNSSNYTTTKTGSERVQVDAKKFVIHQMWSGELEEDSIIPFIPFLRRQQAVSLAHYSDSLVLNGDTTNAGTGNINLDDADPADTKHYLAFDGIRHAGLVDNTNNKKDAAGAINLDLLKGPKSRMLDRTHLHDWGHPVDPNDLVYVSDPETADAIAFLDEVITVDKYGPNATVLTGEQSRVLGHPHIASIALSKTEADGKVSTTGSNNTKGQVVTFNRRGYVVGVRRRARVETERLPASDQTRIVVSTRLGFGRFSPTGAASGIESADVIYNVSV